MKRKTIYVSFALLTFMSCQKNDSKTEIEDEPKSTFLISGSDSEKAMIQLMVKRFESNHNIQVEGGGSRIGIGKLLRGEAHVANSSRSISLVEARNAKSAGVKPYSVIIAMDALAFITNAKNGVDSLSTIQIKKILSGEITNWKEVGGKNLPITIYGRDKNSGTHQYVKDLFLGEDDFPANTKIASSNKDVVDIVTEDSTSFGYVGVAFVKNEFNKVRKGIKAQNVYIEGEMRAYSPLEDQKVMNGLYPFVRPLYQYFNGKPTGELAKFLKFELSDEGQQIVFQYGYFPVSEELNLD
ncbi:MAG: PstS family phosphate ABC transporter substrate-binding protein [Crocinitomicaceae bacterium]|nr:PstS family phosphate ABC transporter substrate-binding protein [Crocinitomicaceae bacterium]